VGVGRGKRERSAAASTKKAPFAQGERGLWVGVEG